MASPIILFKRISPNLKLKVRSSTKKCSNKRKKERECETKQKTKIKMARNP